MNSWIFSSSAFSLNEYVSVVVIVRISSNPMIDAGWIQFLNMLSRSMSRSCGSSSPKYNLAQEELRLKRFADGRSFVLARLIRLIDPPHPYPILISLRRFILLIKLSREHESSRVSKLLNPVILKCRKVSSVC
ncbi:hypothetical protein D3C80_887200 [compost metagenome]